MSQKRRICINIIGQTSDIRYIYIYKCPLYKKSTIAMDGQSVKNGFGFAVFLTHFDRLRAIRALGVSLERSMQ